MERLLSLLGDPAHRIAFAGVGNLLRNDDGVGPYIAARIQKRKNRVIFHPEAGIERYISVINRENADLLVIIDCVDFGKPAGHWEAIHAGQIAETGFNSHNISLKKLTKFFHSDTWVIGVQPADLRVGESLSAPVIKSALEIISLINQT
jgi:hydrogenase 3 maturation protease